MKITYDYVVQGRAAGDQTWEASGEVSTETAGAFPEALQDAMRDAFMHLTQGKAVYGKPGIGCRGPYTITMFHLSRKADG